MKRVIKGTKRQCPHCGSNKWKFVESVPVSLEILQQYLLVKYKCLRCYDEFLAEEGAKSTYVKSAKKCSNCNSGNVKKVSRDVADIELYYCKQCHAYMGVE